MRRDLAFALIVSLLIHGGLVGFSDLFRKPAVKIHRDPEPKVVRIVMPPLEPDLPEITEQHETPTPAADFAPPMLPDVPQLVHDESFVQPFEPPSPDTVHVDRGLVVIPTGRPGGGTGGVFYPAALDVQPTPTYQAKPVYPFEQRRLGLTGDVVVGFIVNTAGAVTDAYVVSSTDRGFEANAVQAVTRWKFKPGRKDGRAVNTRMQVPIVFRVGDGTD